MGSCYILNVDFLRHYLTIFCLATIYLTSNFYRIFLPWVEIFSLEIGIISFCHCKYSGFTLRETYFSINVFIVTIINYLMFYVKNDDLEAFLNGRNIQISTPPTLHDVRRLTSGFHKEFFCV